MPRPGFLDRFNASMLSVGPSVLQGMESYEKQKALDEERKRLAEQAPYDARIKAATASQEEAKAGTEKLGFENRMQAQQLFDQLGAEYDKPASSFRAPGELGPGEAGPAMSPSMTQAGREGEKAKQVASLADSPLAQKFYARLDMANGRDPAESWKKRQARAAGGGGRLIQVKGENGENVWVQAGPEGEGTPLMVGGSPAGVGYAPKPLKTAGDQLVDPFTGEAKSDIPMTRKEGIAYEGLELDRNKDARDAAKAAEEKRKFGEAHKKTLKAFEEEVQQVNDLGDLADEVAKDGSLKYVTGALALGRKIPGTGAADLDAKIERLISSAAIETMAKLKSSSQTGSTGFGALSEKELYVLQTAFSNLSNRKQSPESMKKELQRISKTMKSYYDRIQKYSPEASEPSDGSRFEIMEVGE